MYVHPKPEALQMETVAYQPLIKGLKDGGVDLIWIETMSAEEEMESGTAADQDAKYSKISASYTAGGMTLSGNMSEMENGTYTTAVAGDEEYYGLSLSFAF